MKFVRYSKPGGEGMGVYSDGRVADLSHSYDEFEDMLEEADSIRLPSRGVKVNDSDLLPPVGRTSKILCMAINYRSHIDEQHTAQTKDPILFTKFHSSLTGPYSEIPRFTVSKIMDYEGEIAVVIGKRAKNVRRTEAWGHVLGYTLLNDMSARSLFRVPQGDGAMLDWFSCKTLDRSTPVGPWIVTKDEAGDFTRLRIETFLNGSKVQSADPSDMVFDVPKIIEHASSRVTLEPGDTISTGTPAGVGVARKRTLEKGDVVRVQAEGIGHLENKIV
jgi:acylpyruvate hydrolase